MPDFSATLDRHGLTLARETATTLQVNVGKRCNQACRHCHVDAGPKRTEMMAADCFDRLLALLRTAQDIATVDITGGAPELNPYFRAFVTAVRATGRRVIDRCNLTILSEPGQEDLAGFLAAEGVDVIASLPCYSEGNVDAQRGRGVFERSIEGLRRLNALGYGDRLTLDLVYNPLGAFLPPPQERLEADYRRELMDRFGIRFSRLFTLTNMPIARFAHDLARDGAHDAYMTLLVTAFNPATVAGLMCRDQISVGWDGRLYDCDFNQMLDIAANGHERTIFEIDSFAELSGPIVTGPHCFGCTAGAGSSCGGALS